MGERIGATGGGLLGRDPGAHDLVVLGVDAGQAAGGGDLLERRQQLPVGDPREALRVGLEGRELERGGPGGDERRDLVDRARGAAPSPTAPTSTCASRSTSATLAANASSGVDRTGGVVGHVDDRRHAARGGGARAALDPLAVVAAGVDVDVHRAGQQQRVAEVERRRAVARRRARCGRRGSSGRPVSRPRPRPRTLPEMFSMAEIEVGITPISS